MIKRAKPLSNLSPQVLTVVNSPSFIEHDAGGEVAMLDRLISSNQMASVWDEVNRMSDDEYIPLRFLQLALALPRIWKLLSKTPTAEAKKNVKEIEVAARKLANQLRAHRPEFHLFGVYETGLESLIFSTLTETGYTEVAKCIRDLGYSEALGNDSSAIPDLPTVLIKLADRLKDGLSRRGPFGQRPTKPRDKNSDRTFCVRELVAFSESRMGDNLSFDAVARTVNTILDLHDPIDGDYVKKLVSIAKKKNKVKSEDS